MSASSKVAFIAHPLDMSSLAIMSGWPAKPVGAKNEQAVKQKLLTTKPFVFSQIAGLHSLKNTPIDLIGVACPLLPEQMVSLESEFVLDLIAQSVNLAKSLGARVATLGGFTSVIGNEGQDIAERVGMPVTSGNTYTAALTIQGVEEAMRQTGLKKIKKCSILGATGDIGSACAEYFSERSDHLACFGRDEARFELIKRKFSNRTNQVTTFHKRVADAVQNSDVVISATSALTTIINTDFLKPGSIVCDVALPANIAREVSRKRPDLLVFEGGLSKVPYQENITDSKWANLLPHNAIYGCLAEGLILGHENRFENFSLGRGNITTEKMELIALLAAKHGFGLSEFFCGDKFFSREDLAFIKKQKKHDTVKLSG